MAPAASAAGSRQRWLVCGILAAGLYVAMSLLVGWMWEGYSIASHTISELSAIGAPTRQVWVLLATAYSLLLIVFGWMVWTSSPDNRALRAVGMLLVVQTVFGYFWPPMHQREVLAAGGHTLTDTLHIVWMAVSGIFFLLTLGIGAAALGTRFRLYSLVTIVMVLACGVVTGTYATQIEANLPTPWVGAWERLSASAYMIWIAVLATSLLRAPRAAAGAEVGLSRWGDHCPVLGSRSTRGVEREQGPRDQEAGHDDRHKQPA